MTKFLIVDDHVAVRKGLRQMLGEEYPDATFAEAADATRALQKVLQEDWDLVLIDVTLPGQNGIDALTDLRKARPEIAVIVLSMHAEIEFAVRALKAGAAGYLTKQSAAEELFDAVRKALRGERYITAVLAAQLADTVAGKKTARPHENLSDREFQILLLLAEGKPVKEIAGALCLSPKTVSTYRARVLEKLHLNSTVDLARYALEHQLIE